MITSKERVLSCLAFETPDRIPRFESFWNYDDEWENALGPLENWNDVAIWMPNEGAYPSRECTISEGAPAGTRIYIDNWGRTVRTRSDAYFQEILNVPFESDNGISDLDQFDPPDLDSRFAVRGTIDETLRALEQDKRRYCVFGKIGGLFLRTTLVRGFERFLMDLSGDPGLAAELVERMYEHLLGVALEELRRWNLADTGIWIYDDIAYNSGPMMSPAAFESIFLPRYKRLVAEIKKAGAAYVMLHSDGNIAPLLDMFVEAGFDGIHPVERRTGMDPVVLRERYPRLRFFGGMDNSNLLRVGSLSDIESETKRIIGLGRGGGLTIGSHSIGPDIPIESYLHFHRCCLEHGVFET